MEIIQVIYLELNYFNVQSILYNAIDFVFCRSTLLGPFICQNRLVAIHKSKPEKIECVCVFVCVCWEGVCGGEGGGGGDVEGRNKNVVVVS